MKKILVSGGLGFIGSHLTRALLRDDIRNTVTVVDNLSGTKSDWGDLDAHPRVQVIVDDLRSFSPGGEQFDEVYHLASPVGSLGILASTGRIALDILELAMCAHEIAASCDAPLLYVSSSEVYGADGRHDETTDLVVAHRRGARMEYAVGKLSAEHALYNLSQVSGTAVRIARPFNCAGPGQSQELGFVIPTFVAAAVEGRSLPVHGDGTARRAFCHVEDMVAGFIAIQRHGNVGEVYNVGQPDGALSIGELAQRVLARLGSSSSVHHVDPRVEFGPHWLDAFDKVPVITNITQDTGWRPARSLDEIIDDVAADVRRVRQ